jgi:putative transposase
MTKKVIAHAFFAELREKHDVNEAVFLIDSSHLLRDVCRRQSLDFRYKKTEIEIVSNVSLER